MNDSTTPDPAQPEAPQHSTDPRFSPQYPQQFQTPGPATGWNASHQAGQPVGIPGPFFQVPTGPERPRNVTAGAIVGTAACALGVVIMLLLAIFTLQINSEMARTEQQAQSEQDYRSSILGEPSQDSSTSEDSSDTHGALAGMGAAGIFFTVWSLALIPFWWLAFAGHRWARTLNTVVGCLSALTAVLLLFAAVSSVMFLLADLPVIGYVVAAALHLTPSARRWFASNPRGRAVAQPVFQQFPQSY